MATASNSGTNHHSPRNSSDPVVTSPQSRRPVAARGISSPWTQIVRGESESIISSPVAAAAAAPSSPSSVTFQEHTAHYSDWSPSNMAAPSTSPTEDSVEAQPDSSDNNGRSSNAAKKQAWNKPSNGAVEVGPVMGAVSWPALSESTRASPKSSSESLKALSDGSISVSQGTGVASSPQKQVISNSANPNSTPNHVAPTRQKSMRRASGSSSGSVSANGGFSLPQNTQMVDFPKPASVAPESSFSRDHNHKETGQRGGFGSQSHVDHAHQPRNNSFRRGNGGSHPRGDGSYHHNYGGRRDHDRGNHDWNPHRSFNGRDAHMQPQRVVPRGFIRGPTHTSTPFIPPPVSVPPFGNPMVYPEVASPVIYVPGPAAESLRGVPIIAPMPPPPAMFFPVADPHLHTKIVGQIDYYFSNENLIKDTFLRQNMDEQGWVPIKLISGFKKVMQLTDNIQLILDAVRTSTIVEVQGDKVRRRNDWIRWIMPAVQFPDVSSPQSLGRSGHDTLTTNLQNLTLEEKTYRHGHVDAFMSRSSSGELNSQSQSSSSEGMGQTNFQAGAEHSVLANNLK